MAFYHDAPQKKKKTSYGDLGSWEEEGSRYSDRNSREENDRRGDRKRSAYSSRRDGTGAGPRSEASGRRSGDSGSFRRTGSDSLSRRDDRGDPRFTRGGDKFQRTDSGSFSRREGRGDERSAGGRDRFRRTEPESFSRRESRKDYSDQGWRGPAPVKESYPSEESYHDYEYRQPAPAESVRSAEQEDNILCGRNPIREALRSGRELEKLLVQKGELNSSAREIVQEARDRKIMVQEVDRRRLDEIALHHQGLIAFASAYRYAEVEEMLEEAEKRGEDPFLILLDGVTDPHNLGAVIRTAECAGAHGVIIPVHRSVGLTPAAVKASAGAIEHIRVARVVNLNRTLEDLKRRGIWTYAVTMDGKDFEKVDFHGGTALVIGAEGEGISRLTAEKCDLSVSLPMKGQLDSLNASVAAGIVMYRVLCCRRKV